MRRVLAALAAELAELQPGRGGLLVLGGGVIAVLAISALQRNNLSSIVLFLFVYFAASCREALSASKRGNQRSRRAFRRETLGAPLIPACGMSGFPLRNNFADGAGAYRASAFANRKPQTLFHGHRRDQFNLQAHVVARHHHLRAFRQRRHARHIRGAEIELRPIALEERVCRPPSSFDST